MTISSLVSFSHYRPTRGFLFIGDPHVWSRQPGRRRDANFLATVLGKLEQAARISNELNLWPLCPGDLLHDDADNDSGMLIGLTRTLQKFDRKLVCLVGNHDKNEAHLSERNPLLLLGVANQLHLIDHSGFFGRFEMENEAGEKRQVALGGTPYGDPIPSDVAHFLGQKSTTHHTSHEMLGVDRVVWMTHEDLAFQGAYPGAKPIEEIKGVDVCLNGHMHGTSLPHRAGMTAWFNPGNITRMSVDTMDHKPSVWQWDPFETEEMGTQQGLRVPLLRRHELVHVKGSEIFDMEGRHATAFAPKSNEETQKSVSAFADRLLSDRIQHRSDDGTYTRESLEEILAQNQVPDMVKTITRRLQEQAAEKLGARE